MSRLFSIKYRKLTSILLLTLFILVACPNVVAADSDEHAGLNEIFTVLQLLREDYVKDVDPYSLLDGAMRGIKNHLKVKKLNDVAFQELKIDRDRTIEANMRKFGAAYGKVMMYNGKRLVEEDMAYSALKGMMYVIKKEFKDPYTVAMNPKEFKVLLDQLDSRDFTGIGIFIDLDKKHGNKLTVVEPIEGSPAHNAGLKSGDIILRINNVSTKGMNLDSASNRIRGPAKTPVVLHIKRNGRRTFDVKVVRDKVHVSSLTYKMMGRLGYIKVRFFGENTTEEFQKALKALDDKGAKGLVIDLRNNGGGYVMTAVQLSSNFVKRDTVVTTVVNYRKDVKEVHKAVKTTFPSRPLVVLVNRYSASASEILAGCIQDNRVGVLVGEKTFGKGSVQTIKRLPGGGALKFTTAHYLTSGGKDINKRGIVPDIRISMKPSRIGEPTDIQMRKAVNYLNSEISKN